MIIMIEEWDGDGAIRIPDEAFAIVEYPGDFFQILLPHRSEGNTPCGSNEQLPVYYPVKLGLLAADS
jgi:hypothetical protein